jgi:IclR family mhp operon transcriptional activator
MVAYEPVTAVLRGLAVLREVSVQRSASVRSIQAALGLSRPTIIRMLETLEHADMVRRDARLGTWFVTAKAFELGIGYEFDSVIASAALPVLDALKRRIGWPSDIATFDRDAMVAVATTRQTEDRFLSRHSIGTRAPILASALGLAYLAFASAEDRSIAFASLGKSLEPWNELARDPQIASDRLGGIRRAGFATTDARYAAAGHIGDVRSIAVPVLDGEKAVAALNVTYLIDTLTVDEAIARLVDPLKEAAREISGRLASGRSAPLFDPT